MNLSVVILAKNEEKNIKRAISSVAFADEVIVVDDNSIDQTVEIVTSKRQRVKIYQRNLNRNFARQRNFGLKKAKGNWVLFLDADEVVSRNLGSEIVQAVNDPLRQESAYFVKREDFLFGKKMKHGEVGGAKFIRLVRKNAGRWRRRVHEYWQVAGKTGKLKNPLRHYPHPTLAEFIADINFTSTLHAGANWEEGKRSSLAKIVFWPRFKLFKNYFLKKGFLDGTHGFVLALLMSFHSFLAWSKLWFLQKNLPKSH